MSNLRREALREYLHGALWALPGVAVLVAMAVGTTFSMVNVPPSSPLYKLVFQGTADDARSLLIDIASTMITVIALILGLTVVALQLSSTQYSPRILRNFLRDKPNQIVLSVFVATFAYAAAGLYTVGVSAGARTEQFPRLAVTGAIVMLFLSLAALVYEVHHVAHSMQIDEIMRRIERDTTVVIRDGIAAGQRLPAHPLPRTAVAIAAAHSGYVQTIHAEDVLAVAAQHGLHLRISKRVGDHVAKGAPLGWMWYDSTSRPDATAGSGVELLTLATHDAVRIGFERTLEQDAAFGIRQLVDIASKALSPAVNDPYTAVQAIDRLSVIVATLACRPLGTVVLAKASGSVTVPAYDFADYLELVCAQIRRYGAPEPIVATAVIELLGTAADAVTIESAERYGAIERQLTLILADSERSVEQPADVESVRRGVGQLQVRLHAHGVKHAP